MEMFGRKSMFYIRTLLLVLISIMLVGCAGGSGIERKVPRMSPDQALASVYFSTTGVSTEQISFEISDVSLLMGDLWIDLLAAPIAIDRQEVQGQQRLLGLGAFPAGDCTRIRFSLKNIRVGGNGGPGLEDQQVDLAMNQPVAFAGRDSTCLFIDWHLVPPVPGEARFVPRFSVRGQNLPLGGDLAYVVCDDIDTLYMIRTDVNFVVAALGLTGPLGELAVDAARRRLYVLSTGERAIYVINSANSQPLERISLQIAVKPRHLSLSADGDFAYVTDAATNRVMKVDLRSGLISRQATVGFRPERVLFFNDGSDRLAVSSPTAQRVFILNADTLELLKEIPAGLEADSLLFWQDRLYVGERGNRSVTAFDHRTGRQLARIVVGAEPVAMTAVDNKIIVSNFQDSTLSFFYVGQSSTARSIPVGLGPYALAVSERRRILYVANRDAASLTIMDLVGERARAVVPLGGAPFSIGVLD
jgi:DNA-binding beta-propeller fold protein YncE